MVSFNVYKSTASGTYVEGVCLATDEKPVVGIANGSILFAVDASDGSTTRYMYDQPSMSWVEAACPCSGGGSGSGGGGVNVVLCELDVNEMATPPEVSADKTADELLNADCVVFHWSQGGVAGEYALLERVGVGDGGLRLGFTMPSGTVVLTAANPSDYPEGTMESGGGGGVFNVVLSGDELVADKTFQEISEAFDAGAIIPCYTGTVGEGNRKLYGFISGTKRMLLGAALVLTPLGGGDTIQSSTASSPSSYPQFNDGVN